MGLTFSKSGDLTQEFFANPAGFLASNRVNDRDITDNPFRSLSERIERFSALNADKAGRFSLAKVQGDIRILPDPTGRPALFCPYIPGKHAAGWVDVPKVPATGQEFVFTGGLSGCTLKVAPSSREGHFGLFHDNGIPGTGAQIPDPTWTFGPEDYSEPGNSYSRAFAFLWYDTKQWVLVCQPNAYADKGAEKLADIKTEVVTQVVKLP